MAQFPFRYTPPPAELFVRNRAAFAEKLSPGTFAVLYSNVFVGDNADSHYRFSQNSNFYYLSGLDQEACILVLAPDAPNPREREVLFVPPTTPEKQLWEGWKYSIEEAQAASGMGVVRYLAAFEGHLQKLLGSHSGVYLDFNEHARASAVQVGEAYNLAQRLRTEFPAHAICRAAPLLAAQRMLKQPEEIQQLKTAVDITASAFQRVLATCRPGVLEYELEAEISHEFIRRGATGHAYSPIIAGGKNACILHYNQNSAPLQDGDLLLMDFGAEYGNYSADLSRTIPVNGRFTARQKAVYEAVYRVHQNAIRRLKPGLPFSDYLQAAHDDMDRELVELGLLTKADVEKAPEHLPACKKYFPHGLSHHLGLDTHDQGSFDITLEAGMVFTVEPGIYLNDEGIGIRLENDVLITANGPEDLMAEIPLTAEAIEAAMAA